MLQNWLRQIASWTRSDVQACLCYLEPDGKKGSIEVRSIWETRARQGSCEGGAKGGLIDPIQPPKEGRKENAVIDGKLKSELRQVYARFAAVKKSAFRDD